MPAIPEHDITFSHVLVQIITFLAQGVAAHLRDAALAYFA